MLLKVPCAVPDGGQCSGRRLPHPHGAIGAIDREQGTVRIESDGERETGNIFSTAPRSPVLMSQSHTPGRAAERFALNVARPLAARRRPSGLNPTSVAPDISPKARLGNFPRNSRTAVPCRRPYT